MFPKRRRLIGYLLAAFALPAAYGQNGTFTTASAGNWTAFVAPDSIAAGFGVSIATGMTSATGLPLGTSLASTSVNITDSAGNKAAAPLYFVSPGQINYLVPANLALGKASVSVTGASSSYTGTLEISNVSPAIFDANNNGFGVAAAQYIRVSASGQVTTQLTYSTGVLSYTPNPISLLPTTDKVYLILYGTGIRRHSANPVKATINGVPVPVTYAGAQSTLPGLDQVNLGPLPQTLAGTGKASFGVVVLVDGIPSNTTQIGIQ